MVIFYVDTCIWRDYLEDRSDKFRPLGEWAFQFFQKIKSDNNKIIITECLLYEIEKEHDISYFFSAIDDLGKERFIFLKSKNGHINKAKIIRKKYKIPFFDALHTTIAIENNAVIITRDKHFASVSKIIPVRKPEELI